MTAPVLIPSKSTNRRHSIQQINSCVLFGFISWFITAGLFFYSFQSYAQNGPICNSYANRTTANGLGSNSVYGVYAVGNTVYAATSNGLSISTDGGTSFTNKTIANGLGSNNVRRVFVVSDPTSTTIYAATSNGLSISTDGGLTFSNKTTANGLGSNDLTSTYAAGNTIYAATNGSGLSISTDGGTSFVNKTTANGLGNSFVYDAYAMGSTVYAATFNGLSISTDGGASFINKTTANGLGNNLVLKVYVVGSTVYAATGFYSGTTAGLSISTDGGATFTNKTMADGLGNNYVGGVYAAGSTIYAATTNGLGISSNGGASFTNYTTTNGLGNSHINSVYATGSTVYAATDGGLSLCPPPAASLTMISSVSPSTLCAGTTTALSVTTTGGSLPYSYTWTAPEGTTLSATSTSAVSATATTSGVKTFTLTVASSGGSPTSTTTISVTVAALPTPSITASPSLTIASGQSATLTATGANSFLWSTNEITTSIVANAAGPYSVTATNLAGCSARATVVLSLTSSTAPDLTAVLSLPDVNFPATPNSSKDFLVSLFEVGGLPTSSGTITINITAPTGYTLSFTNSLTSINVSGGGVSPISVSNSLWDITNNVAGQQLSLTMKRGQWIPANDQIKLGLTIMRTTANSGSVSNITVNISNDASKSYDVNPANNIYARIISGL